VTRALPEVTLRPRLCYPRQHLRFHHVSRAYVCGLRSGRVLERELDVGQTPGKDYERSKLQAETMVLEAPHLSSRTVYRPGIISGDSRMGYTSTFHGFYVPLKIAHGMVSSWAAAHPIDVRSPIDLFGVSGSDAKNLVPVDWVSEVMVRIIADPALHGAPTT